MLGDSIDFTPVFDYEKANVLHKSLPKPSLRIWCDLTKVDISAVIHPTLVNLQVSSGTNLSHIEDRFFNALVNSTSLQRLHLNTNALEKVECHRLIYRSNLSTSLAVLVVWGRDLKADSFVKALGTNTTLRKLEFRIKYSSDIQKFWVNWRCNLEFFSVTFSERHPKAIFCFFQELKTGAVRARNLSPISMVLSDLKMMNAWKYGARIACKSPFMNKLLMSRTSLLNVFPAEQIEYVSECLPL